MDRTDIVGCIDLRNVWSSDRCPTTSYARMPANQFGIDSISGNFVNHGILPLWIESVAYQNDSLSIFAFRDGESDVPISISLSMSSRATRWSSGDYMGFSILRMPTTNYSFCKTGGGIWSDDSILLKVAGNNILISSEDDSNLNWFSSPSTSSKIDFTCCSGSEKFPVFEDFRGVELKIQAVNRFFGTWDLVDSLHYYVRQNVKAKTGSSIRSSLRDFTNFPILIDGMILKPYIAGEVTLWRGAIPYLKGDSICMDFGVSSNKENSSRTILAGDGVLTRIELGSHREAIHLCAVRGAAAFTSSLGKIKLTLSIK